MILYPDSSSELIAKLRPLLVARPEPFTDGVTVADRKPSGSGPAVVVSQGPETDLDTLNTTFVRVNVYSRNEYDAKDLSQMVRALITGRGEGTVCDGDPFTYGRLNAGPNFIDNDTATFQWYLVFELQLRGSTLSPA